MKYLLLNLAKYVYNLNIENAERNVKTYISGEIYTVHTDWKRDLVKVSSLLGFLGE